VGLGGGEAVGGEGQGSTVCEGEEEWGAVAGAGVEDGSGRDGEGSGRSEVPVLVGWEARHVDLIPGPDEAGGFTGLRHDRYGFSDLVVGLLVAPPRAARTRDVQEREGSAGEGGGGAHVWEEEGEEDVDGLVWEEVAVQYVERVERAEGRGGAGSETLSCFLSGSLVAALPPGPPSNPKP
jgi:hypothetical protein